MRERSAGQPGSGTPSDERYASRRAGADRRRHLFGSLGQDDESGDDAVVHEAVAVVGPQLGGVRDDAAEGQERPQLGDHALDVHAPIMSPTPSPMQVGAAAKSRG